MNKLNVYCLILLIISTEIFADHNVFHTDETVMILPIIRVVDGDNIQSALTLPIPLNKISIRLSGINTPCEYLARKVRKRTYFGDEG